MNIIFVLIAISIVLAVGFLCAFLWAVKQGQYDDSYSPAVRILFDDEIKNNNNSSRLSKKTDYKKISKLTKK